MLLQDIIEKFPNDSGPIYQETIQGRLPVEPFNTFSNLLFLYVIYYFFIRIKSNPKQHPYLLIALPVIFISWVGGTVFHGTRSHEFWLVLDWLPIMLLCLGVMVYFIGKITRVWWQRIAIFLGLILFTMLPRFIPLERAYRISFGYGITAVTVMIPFVWYAYKTQWKNFSLIFSGVLVFGIAIMFRTLDNTIKLLPMGTHWLWHSFGAIAVFLLLLYIYRDNK